MTRSIRERGGALCALLLTGALGACTSHDPGEIGSDELALASQISNVTLRTALQGRFVSAQNNGGGAVTATAATAQAWETFQLLDVGGGGLDSGDAVYIRTGGGLYLRAASGGGAGLDATSASAQGWEMFRIVKPQGGAIRSGDVVGLQTITSGSWISAEQGGGGAVHAYGTSLGPWEQLVISVGSSTPTATRFSGVTFRTRGNRYLGAQNNGGGAVVATAAAPQAWETFSLLDANGGVLESGDRVHVITGGGQYLQAASGGGAALTATGNQLLGWETFRAIKPDGGAIASGDEIGLQTESGAWVSAEQAGGGAVHADGAAYGDWERLAVTLGPSRWVTGSDLGGGGGDGWRLVWRDEFDGNALDESKWAYEIQGPRWVNNELQAYTRRPENVRVENGQLVIEARRDFVGGEYSSGRIKTQGRASWTYGRVEASVQVPSGWGTWPAFWMMPDNQRRGWPACGEIDILEHVGYDENVIHGTTHSQAYNWRSPNQRTGSTRISGATTGFHTYALEWTPDRIMIFVDGVHFFTSPNDHTGDDAWPFDKNFHIILNLAVGGDWGGARGVDPNIWPRQMRVDWVRVYQR
jgi:hypothetical protein